LEEGGGYLRREAQVPSIVKKVKRSYKKSLSGQKPKTTKRSFGGPKKTEKRPSNEKT